MAVSQSISLTQGIQNVVDNNTQVTFKWTSTQSGESYNDYTRTAYYYVSINGGAEKEYSVSYTLPHYTTQTIVNTTITVPHNNDGTGSISIRTWMDTRISAGVVQKSASLTLTTIPRASKIDSFSGADLSGNFSVKYTSYYGGFTNKLRISIPNVKALETFNYTSGTDFKLSAESLGFLYSYTSNTDKVQLGAVIETWNGDTKIGESAELVHYFYVSSNIKPSLGTITLDPVNIITLDKESRDILVKDKNKISVNVYGSTPGTGSKIQSYTFAVLSGSTTIASTTIATTATSVSVSLGPFSHTGKLKLRVTVTDNRSRYISNSGSELTFTCHDYKVPYFTEFDAYRANYDGIPNVNGTYLKCTYTQNYSSVDYTNNTTITVHYNGQTSNETLINLGESDKTYNVYLTIKDNYGGENKTSVITVFGQSRIFNITSDGTGFAIGKMAESKELFECRWPAKFDGNVVVGSSTQNSTPTAGIAVHDVRDADVTPDSFGDQNANFYFDQIDSKWMSILHMKGWTGNYAAWELAGNANNSSSDNTLKYRQGIGDTWGDWQTVITNKNINDYVDQGSYLPLNGGTLTGKLTLANDLYNSNNTAGIDCRNSDIVGANGIFFNDTTDSTDEGIHFYRSSNYWDTLYAQNGVLKFHPNKSTSTALGGYTIYNNNNFKIETGTVTLNSSTATTKAFLATTQFAGTPNIILTPVTTTTGVVTAKICSANATSFTAIVGGSVSGSIQFAYIAMHGNAV